MLVCEAVLLQLLGDQVSQGYLYLLLLCVAMYLDHLQEAEWVRGEGGMAE